MTNRYLVSILYTISITVLLGVNAFSKTTRSNGGGDWHTSGSWDNGVPIAGDIVYIENGDVITISANAFCTTLNIEDNNSGLTISSNTLTVTYINITGTVNSQTNPIIVNGSLLSTNVVSYKAEGFTNLNLTISGSGSAKFNQNVNSWATLAGSQTFTVSAECDFVKSIYLYAVGAAGSSKFNVEDSIRIGSGIAMQTVGGALASNVVFDVNHASAKVKLDGSISLLSSGGVVSSGANASTLYIADVDALPDNSDLEFYDIRLASTSSLNANRVVYCSNDFIVNSGVTLSTAGFDLTLSAGADLVNNGTISFSSGDILSFDGSSAQNINSSSELDITVLDISNSSGGVSISGSDINITEGVTFTTAAATALTTNNKLTLKDNGSGMANLGNLNTHTVSGNITCEFRTQTLTNIEYRMLSIPVASFKLGGFDYDASTCTTCPYSYGYTGSNQTSAGGLASSYTYSTSAANTANDFNTGWTASSSNNDDFDAENAVTWYIGPGSGSFSRTSYSVDVSGAPNTGPYNIGALSFNSSAGSHRNWALIGNPFPSTINFANVTQNAVDKDPYLFKPDNGGYAIDNIIPPFQAFFVKVTAGTSPSIVFNEDDKVTTQKVYQKNIKDLDEIVIKLTPNQFPSKFTYTYLNFMKGTTNKFDVGIDKEPLTNPYPYANVSCKTTDNKYTYKYVTDPEQGHIEIPLNAFGYVSGIYELSFSNLDKIEGCVILEDKFLGTMKTLEKGDSTYAFNLQDSTTVARFSLHVYNFKKDIITTNSNCYNENNGSAKLDVYQHGNFTAHWYNSDDVIIHTSISMDSSESLQNLMPGNYYVEVISNSLICPTLTEYFTIHEPSEIKTNFGFANQLLSFRTDNEIEFKNLSSGGISSYLWEFGDNQTSTDMNPIHSYSEAGVYDIVLTSENGTPECNVMHKQSIEVAEATGLKELSSSSTYQLVYENGDYWIHFNSASRYDFNYSVYDIQGKQISNGILETGSMIEKLDIEGKGVLLISLNYNGAVETIKVHK